MIIYNLTRGTVLADRCRFADTVWKRMVGLLNRNRYDPGEGLVLNHCYGIHTFFMRFPIDVLFLDQDYRVLRTVPELRPFRTSVVKKAVYVVELPAGTISRSQTQVGDQIQIRTAPPAPPTETNSYRAAEPAR